MEDTSTEAVPLASAAAWSPTAAPQPASEHRVLTLEEAAGPESAVAAGPEPEPEGEREAPEPALAAAPAIDRLAALRDIARRLRTTPEADETLQFVVDQTCAATRSDAAMLRVAAPADRRFVCGTAMGAGAYVSLPLRAGGPSVGELVLTRLAQGDEFRPEEETFAELVAEQVAQAVVGLRAGTAVSREAQDFIDRVTEELRPPLAGAVSTLSAALAGELPEGARRYLETAAADAGRLLATVEDLLRLAHLRAPELREMESVPVGPWLERVAARAQPAAERRGITLTVGPPEEAAVVQGVPVLLDALLGQLVANAVKFTEAGGRVDVSGGVVDGQVRVCVQDTGIGFDPAEANRMTECFTRALSAEAARIPGLGVGLFLANEIAGHHHGRLWLETGRDEGTKAHVELPPHAG